MMNFISTWLRKEIQNMILEYFNSGDQAEATCLGMRFDWCPKCACCGLRSSHQACIENLSHGNMVETQKPTNCCRNSRFSPPVWSLYPGVDSIGAVPENPHQSGSKGSRSLDHLTHISPIKVTIIYIVINMGTSSFEVNEVYVYISNCTKPTISKCVCL